jgi:hypothetical protein
MINQLSLIPVYGKTTEREAYVIQGQERGDDLPRLRESAKTIEARVLAWFAAEIGTRTPTMCAEALGLPLTTVRPRITCLLNQGRLERCKWLPRKPTKSGSEGWYRFKEGGE